MIDKDVIKAIDEELRNPELMRRRRPLRNPKAPREFDAILQVALNYPGMMLSQVVARCSRELGGNIEENVGRFLHNNRIFYEAHRIEARSMVTSIAEAFHTILQAQRDESALAAQDQLWTWTRKYKDANFPAVCRMVLITEINRMHEAEDPAERRLAANLHAILDQCGLGTSARLFKNIVHKLDRDRSTSRRPSLSDRLTDMINEAASAAEIPVQTSENTTDTDADALAEENADLRAALFGLKSELEMLQDQIRSLQSTSTEAATAHFLSELNSSASGNLLDNLIYSSRAIRDLEATGWIPEPIEVEGIVATVTMLSDHLGRIGVQPIFEVGSLTEIVMEDLAEVQYIGSEFAGPTENKLVRFRSPGWRYRGQQIARAQAIEVVTDSTQTKA